MPGFRLVRAGFALLFLPGLILSMGRSPVSAEGFAGPAAQRVCTRIELTGEVNAGQAWSAEIGEGWVFRVVPIPDSGKRYTGWDLVMDRLQGGGYPDALLLATPPYGSVNEREIGTTFGMRAQDAIAWEPRRFQFLTSTRDLTQAKMEYSTLFSGADAAARSEASSQLMRRMEGASTGRFEVLDARLTEGVADPPPFAQEWAAHLSRVPHTLVPPSGTPSPRGELLWVRFSVLLWLPRQWRPPLHMQAQAVKCAQ